MLKKSILVICFVLLSLSPAFADVSGNAGVSDKYEIVISYKSTADKWYLTAADFIKLCDVFDVRDEKYITLRDQIKNNPAEVESICNRYADFLKTSIDAFIYSTYTLKTPINDADQRRKVHAGIDALKTHYLQHVKLGTISSVRLLYSRITPLILENQREFMQAAVEKRQVEVVSFFIGKGLRVNYTQPQLDTPFLHIAAGNLDLPMVKLFIKNKADVNATDIIEYTAIDTAVCGGLSSDSTEADKKTSYEIVKLLIDSGAKVKFYKHPDNWKYNKPQGATDSPIWETVEKDTLRRAVESKYAPLIELLGKYKTK